MQRSQRFSQTEQAILDWLGAVGLAALVWAQIAVPVFVRGGFPFPGPREFGGEHIVAVMQPTFLAYFLVAMCFLPLGLRRRFPWAVLGAVTAAAAIYEQFPHPPTLTILGVLISVYSLGTIARERWQLVAGASVSCAVMLSVSLPGFSSPFWLAEFLRTVLAFGFVAVLGDAVRNRRAYVAEVESRAIEAETTRDEEARRRVDEERLRIARELHDVTAHSLSIIAVQSGAALHVIDEKPAEARSALVAIRKTSREALQELRDVLGVLRREGDGEPAARAPEAGLEHLPELVAQVHKAGLDVDVKATGDTSALPAVVDASAYRVVQEALTNVLRHAGAKRAVVTIAAAENLLAVDVSDDGSGPTPQWTEGHGVAGMRERATALGGAFDAGPAPSGGFRVSVRYPLPPTASTL